MQECASEFVSFITSEACDRCSADKRKTISGEDIIESFKAMGLEQYVPYLTAYLEQFRKVSGARNRPAAVNEYVCM